MLLVSVSCVSDVGADDDRPSVQRSKTRYCMGWRICVCKHEMLLVLLSGGRRTHECELQLNDWTWRAVFGGVALLRTLLFFCLAGLSHSMLC